ncbi:MAG TPA: hypothetical protein V6C85_26690 [Allocoleopsis sp.]
MKDNIEIVTAIIGLIIGLSGAVAAIYTRWKAAVEKGYAAQRDFAHLRRNQEQMSQGIAEINKDADARFDRIDLSLNRVESMLHTLLAASTYPVPRRHKDDDSQLD